MSAVATDLMEERMALTAMRFLAKHPELLTRPHAARREALLDRLAVKQSIQICARRGRVHVLHWSRDCDLCETTRIFTIKATIEAFEEASDRCADSAEGPWSLRVVSHRFARDFQPSSRDRGLEHFENHGFGH